MADENEGGKGTETAPKPPDPQGGTNAENGGGETPPWGENFDPQRAWNTITTLRGKEKELGEVKTRLQKMEDEQKSDSQREKDRADREAARANEVEGKLLRFEVAAEKQIPSALASRLQGSTKEEIAADADRLIQELGLEVGGGSGGGGTTFDAGVRTGSRRQMGMNEFIRTGGRGR